MELKKIIDQRQLNSFIARQEHSPFQQSWEWGRLQEAAGYEILRLGVEEDGALIATATFVKKDLGFGMGYWYCPRGPVVDLGCPISDFEYKAFELIVDGIRRSAENRKNIFLRFEPQSQISNLKLQIMRTIDVQPSRTIILDLSRAEEELLDAMHQKTRYNIRLAEKRGVRITDAGPDRFDEFWQIMQQTKDRDAFRLHDRDHYRKLIEIGSPSSGDDLEHSGLMIRLIFAEYENEAIAANIVAFFGDTATYVHGASANENRNVMAPFLLQWHAIQRARQLGCRYYDFYGIDEKKWPGVTRFKRGFNGEEKTFPGTYDMIFSPFRYRSYDWARKFRRKFK